MATVSVIDASDLYVSIPTTSLLCGLDKWVLGSGVGRLHLVESGEPENMAFSPLQGSRIGMVDR